MRRMHGICPSCILPFALCGLCFHFNLFNFASCTSNIRVHRAFDSNLVFMHERPVREIDLQYMALKNKFRFPYFCFAIMSGLICDRVVRPAESDTSFGDGLMGNLVRLDLLRAADGVPCSLMLDEKFTKSF